MRIIVSPSGALPEPLTVSPKPAKAVSPSRTAAMTSPGAPEPRKAKTPANPTASSSSASARSAPGAINAAATAAAAAKPRAGFPIVSSPGFESAPPRRETSTSELPPGIHGQDPAFPTICTEARRHRERRVSRASQA